MATWTFRTPSVNEGPVTWTDRLGLRLKLPRGISVLEGPAGVYTTRRFPTQDDLAAAVSYYLGGTEHVVDDTTKAALIAANIGVTSANFSPA